ncbi:MAG: cytochrome-c peroxidase, partial [Bacteroidota bacterium]|nr:cytochrome-c peroxidase [Bacteroidota bacterium]
PLSEEGFQLGKKLFFDGRLSIDGNFACASCHQPVAAFTTFEHDRSHGYNHSHTLRNAPGLFNLAWLSEYRQDGSGKALEDVYRAHITNPNEMAETIPNVINKIRDDADYKRMFAAAFGNEKVTEDRMYNALTQFVMNLVSADSKYDKIQRGQASFAADEQAGYVIFKAKCATCHTEPMFTDFSYRNNGLEFDAALNDHGRMRVTGNSSDDLKFRVPSLRNCDLTSYYGHDGRYSVFRMMIEHYRFTVTAGPTLDPLLVNGIQLTNLQEDQLVAFIRTLIDSAFLNNPRYKQ